MRTLRTRTSRLLQRMRRSTRRGVGAVAVALLTVGATGAPPPSATNSAPTADTGDSERPPVIAVPGHRQAGQVAVLTIEGAIDGVTFTSLRRRMDRAVADGAEAIVFELDTPGGEVLACLDITYMIKTDAPANTVAWVHPQAYSAGTIIALACREIVAVPGASFGDAAPITAFPLPAAERAKAEAPILTEVIDSARRNHYDEQLVQAFVSVGIELWMLEHIQTGERIFVGVDEYETVFGEAPAVTINSVTPPPLPEGAERPPISPLYDPMGWLAERGVLPTGALPGQDATTISEDPEYAQTLPPNRERLTDADAGQWRVLGQVISNDRLLTLRPAEGLAYGLLTEIVPDDAALSAYFGGATITRYHRSWSESLVRFMSGPVIRGLLIVIFLICLFLEMATPGSSIFGGAAAVALLILLVTPMLTGAAQWWDILLVMTGLLFIGVELFLLPGMGLAGVAGAVFLLVGLVGTFVSGDLFSTQGQTELLTGIFIVFTALFTAIVSVWLLSKRLGTLPVLRRMVLEAEITSVHDVSAAAVPRAISGQAPPPPATGTQGTTTTELRPTGRVQFGSRIIDATSTGSWIDRGRPVEVVRSGIVVEVEEIRE